MIVLDENVPESQSVLLRGWRIVFRQVGQDIGRKGMKDDAIIPLLHEMDRPTFFTLDDDFYDRQICHDGYCMVYLDIGEDMVAEYVRRFLRHREFRTKAKRMGLVIRASSVGVAVWHKHRKHEIIIDW